MTDRIESVRLQGFRGSPLVTAFDLLVPKARGVQQPGSLVLFGDNGTGKSTLVDGVEWCLRGTIGRALAPSPTILSVGRAVGRAEVTVTTAGGTVHRRSAILKDEHERVSPDHRPLPNYRFAPISLKRRDLVRFFDMGGPGSTRTTGPLSRSSNPQPAGRLFSRHPHY